MTELSLFNSIFNDLMGTSGNFYSNASAPRVDITEENNAYTLEMELPGRSENDVTIELERDSLKIASKTSETEEKESDKKKEDKKEPQYILKERRIYDFERRFKLPNDVDAESISANFKNGVLSVTLGKKAVAAPRKIAIEAC